MIFRNYALCSFPGFFVCPADPRNLSSVNEKTRQMIRETNGLVDALVSYIQSSLESKKVEDKVRRSTMDCLEPD